MARKATGQVIAPKGKQKSWALRFRAYGKRRWVTLGKEGWTRQRAEAELERILAEVKLGIWQPARTEPAEGEPPPEPTFHEFASEWMEAHGRELRDRTRDFYRHQLVAHLLPFFADHRLSEITVEEVDRYRQAKVREGDLGAESINKTLVRLAQILEVALEYGYIERNPARGRRRRLKVDRPRPVYLDSAEHITVLLEAAAELDARPTSRTEGRAPLIAVLMFAGLRVTEACRLRWRDVNLPSKRLTVRQSKTDAGVRDVDLLPILQDALLDHRAKTFTGDQDAPVFTTARGKSRGGQARDKDNVNARVVRPVVKRAGELLAERDLPPLPDGLTAHKLRHTFASALVACGEDPAFVMAQIGHSDPRFTLRVYTHLMRRGEDRERLENLVGSGRLGGAAQWIDPVPTTPEAEIPLG